MINSEEQDKFTSTEQSRFNGTEDLADKLIQQLQNISYDETIKEIIA